MENYILSTNKKMKKFLKNIMLSAILISLPNIYPSYVKTPETLEVWLQEFTYQSDADDYWKSPEETIKDNGGDCEDYAILVDMVLSDFGYDITIVALYFSDKASEHTIAILKIDGYYTIFSNNEYYSRKYENLGDLLNDYYPTWNKICLINPKKPNKGITVAKR